jgi:protein TonB
MKKVFFESLDDLVFKGKNHAYGSYMLRKKYPKHVIISLLLGFSFLGAVVAYPLINAYINKSVLMSKSGVEIGVEMRDIPNEESAPPPPPPPPPEAMVENVKFTAPVVVEDSMVETNFASMDDLNQRPNTEAPGSNVEVEIQESTPAILEEPPVQEIFTVVEEQPSFPGGEEARIGFLLQSIKYPEEAKELGIQGKVFVTFVIETDGSITDVKVLRGIGGGCDEEAIRVVSLMPKWIPGKQRGTSVRVQFNLPIKFTLQ